MKSGYTVTAQMMKFGVVAAFALMIIINDGRAFAQVENVLYSFGDSSTDGARPESSLIFDSVGNLYGTTSSGGIYGYGAAFELSPVVTGGWTVKVLHNFGNGKDGMTPYAGLVFDPFGNLYGTTSVGGAYGLGTAFKLSPKAGGQWAETIIHNFGNGKDGNQPLASLILDAAGNLYGTTVSGGEANEHGGTVFELMPTAGGGYTERILHNFADSPDGSAPFASVTFDAAGNLYGTTEFGGTYSSGTMFELIPSTGRFWFEKVIHTCNYPADYDGVTPVSPLIFDTAGNLYGTTVGGGFAGGGTAFELMPEASGLWKLRRLRNFGSGKNDARAPRGGVIFDSSGNLYGTTVDGGTYGTGTVFELTPAVGKSWTETILHEFGTGSDGSYPYDATPIFDAAGNLYGTTITGGIYGEGTVFELTP